MTDDLKRYHDYKSLDINRLGDMPAHWEMRLSFLRNASDGCVRSCRVPLPVRSTLLAEVKS